MNLESYVNFYGTLSYHEIINILKESSCLLSTSVFEGFQIARLEALALGLCIITTKTAGIQNLLTKDKTCGHFNYVDGIFVAETSTKKEIARLMQLSNHEKYWTVKSITNRQNILSKVHPVKIANDYLALFNSDTKNESL